MRCFRCKEETDRVISTRSTKDGTSIRRRRECRSCGARVTTYEEASEKAGPSAVDETGKCIKPSDVKNKSQKYIDDACVNLSVSLHERDHAAESIAFLVKEYGEALVPTDVFFGWIAEMLGELHEVARVRFELSVQATDIAECIPIILDGVVRECTEKVKLAQQCRTETDEDIPV